VFWDAVWLVVRKGIVTLHVRNICVSEELSAVREVQKTCEYYEQNLSSHFSCLRFKFYLLRPLLYSFPPYFNSEFPSQALNPPTAKNSVIKRAVTFWRPFVLRKKFVSCAQHSDRVWGQPRLLSSVYHGFFSKGKQLERETDHSPPSCPRLIRNWVTYRHFPYIKSGFSITAGQINLLSSSYEFYSTLVGYQGPGIGHLQPSFFSVNYNRQDKADIQFKPQLFCVQTMCECNQNDM